MNRFINKSFNGHRQAGLVNLRNAAAPLFSSQVPRRIL
jgi:hypothetical protein